MYEEYILDRVQVSCGNPHTLNPEIREQIMRACAVVNADGVRVPVVGYRDGYIEVGGIEIYWYYENLPAA